MADLNDLITDVRNAARPNSARVSSTRSAGGANLACDNLVGWPTASKVHFVTYQIDSSSEPVAGTQLDCEGIVSGNTITSFTVIDGTDNGHSVGDVVEMLPTAGWAQDLADALTSEHNRDGTHSAITADSLSTDTITEQTAAAGVTIDGLNIKDSKLATNNSVVTANITDDAVTPAKWTNPYNFKVTHSTTQSTGTGAYGDVTFDTEIIDTNSNFASNTYTAPVAGVYLFGAHARTSSTSQRFSVAIAVSGTIMIKGSELFDDDNHSGSASSASGLLSLAAGSTVTVKAIGNTTLTIDAGEDDVAFWGFLVHQTS